MDRELLTKLNEVASLILELRTREHGKADEPVRYQEWEQAFKNLENTIKQVNDYLKTETK